MIMVFNFYLDCDCDPNGSKSLQCDNDGNCQCKEGLNISTDPKDGGKCDSCVQDYYGFPNCKGKYLREIIRKKYEMMTFDSNFSL